MSPYRERYHRDLNELKTLTQQMAEEVSMAIDQSVTALREINSDKAKEVIRGDQSVDDLALKVENLCMELLALQQPMAKDLRMIIGILKISIDLERIGDLAVDIARVTIQTKREIHVTKLEFIPHMAEIARKMLFQAVEALKKNFWVCRRMCSERKTSISMYLPGPFPRTGRPPGLLWSWP